MESLSITAFSTIAGTIRRGQLGTICSDLTSSSRDSTADTIMCGTTTEGTLTEIALTEMALTEIALTSHASVVRVPHGYRPLPDDSLRWGCSR